MFDRDGFPTAHGVHPGAYIDSTATYTNSNNGPNTHADTVRISCRFSALREPIDA